jgi:hypothetical protein
MKQSYRIPINPRIMWDIPEYGRFLKWGIPFFVTLGVSTLGVSTLIIMVY